MAQSFYSVEKAAEVLGISPEEVKQMRERHELYGYRDGANWKFKSEEIDRMAEERRSAGSPDTGDILLSEVELGQAGPGSSGTVIGMGSGIGGPGASDIQLVTAQSGLDLSGSGKSGGGKSGSGKSDKKKSSDSAKFEDLDLALDEDFTLADSQVGMSKPARASDSSLDLTATGEGLDDSDLVLAGSGSGSDVTIGGDSGISLVDPADSGLSLEKPVELRAASTDDSLELGEDDLMAASGSGKLDEEFALTTADEGEDEDDSGSQVIALDTEAGGDEAVTMIGGPATASMVAMLDEDLSTAPMPGVGTTAVSAATPGFAPMPQIGLGPEAAMVPALPEAPYSIWNVLSLALCIVILSLVGMMMYDLLRNMWSWNGTYSITSSIMDFILGLFEK